MPSKTTDKGLVAETAILAELVRLGYSVLMPIDGSARSDLAIDFEGGLVRIQCKFGQLVDEKNQGGGCVRFWTSSSRKVAGYWKHEDYQNHCDLFACYCPDVGSFAVPVHEAPASQITLRLTGTKNGQSKGVRLAEDYRLEAAFGRLAATKRAA